MLIEELELNIQTIQIYHKLSLMWKDKECLTLEEHIKRSMFI